jgi:hypothetical protein
MLSLPCKHCCLQSRYLATAVAKFYSYFLLIIFICYFITSFYNIYFYLLFLFFIILLLHPTLSFDNSIIARVPNLALKTERSIC